MEGTDLTEDEVLTVVDTLTITVDDGEDTPTPISDATVVIGETSETTDSNGECTFTDMPYEDYLVTITATGYQDKTETIQFRSNHKSFTISLTSA